MKLISGHFRRQHPQACSVSALQWEQVTQSWRSQSCQPGGGWLEAAFLHRTLNRSECKSAQSRSWSPNFCKSMRPSSTSPFSLLLVMRQRKQGGRLVLAWELTGQSVRESPGQLSRHMFLAAHIELIVHLFYGEAKSATGWRNVLKAQFYHHRQCIFIYLHSSVLFFSSFHLKL